MKLGRLEQINLRDQWRKEDTDFTPWLATEENIEILGETLGIGLEVLNQERNVGPFRADILCRDTDNNKYVLIENQLERTDHTHLGQIMTYAAGLDAVTIIWIARKFTEEHRAALDWLNRITIDSINFFGIEIELYKIGDSLPAPLFKILSNPNDWTKYVKKTTSNQNLSEAKVLQQEYWQGLKDYLEEHNSFIKLRRPQSLPWTNISIGKGDIFISASLTTKNMLSVYLYIVGNNSKDYFDRLSEIGKENSFKLISNQIQWKRYDNQKQQVILLTEEGDYRNKNDWERQFTWFRKNLESFVRYFKPIVKSL